MTTKQKQLILCWFGLLEPEEADGIWGPRSMEATRKLQDRLGLAVDGVFGQNTEKEALEAMIKGEAASAQEDFWDSIAYFAPQEFACKCGRYCDGWPHEVQPLLVKIADRARKHFGRPITIVSGLRCSQHNSNVGGVSNSQHMYGEAADVYVQNADPNTVLSWFQSQEDVRYVYRIEDSDNIHYDIAKGAR